MRDALAVIFLLAGGCEPSGAMVAPDAAASEPHASTAAPPRGAPPTATSPAPAIPPPRATVAAGADHTCAIVRRVGDDRDRIKCWGGNDSGQLGLGDRKPRGTSRKQLGDALPFVPLDEGAPVVAVAAGHRQSCALQQGGKLWCWGDNPFGGLGQGDTEARGDGPGELAALRPIDLPGAVTSVSVGSFHACALLDGGTVRCWGLGSDGQLGLGDAEARGDTSGEMGAALPQPALGTGLRAQAIAAGDGHTCVLFEGTAVKCFGRGMAGSLGLDDTDGRGTVAAQMGDALPRLAFAPDFRVQALASGAGHVCALATDHRITCWGNNHVGQLGLGHAESPGGKPGQRRTAQPTGAARPIVDLGPEGRAVAIAAGNAHSCALLERGPADLGVKCWGWDGAGQLGLPQVGARGDQPDEMGAALPFVELGTDLVPVAITAGGDHTCAIVLTRDEAAASPRPRTGRLKCWGLVERGALGIDPRKYAPSDPERMGDGLPFVELGRDVGVVLPE